MQGLLFFEAGPQGGSETGGFIGREGPGLGGGSCHPLLPRHGSAGAGKDVAAKAFALASQLCKWFPTKFHLNLIAPDVSVSTDTRQIEINTPPADWCNDRPGAGVGTYHISLGSRKRD